MLTKEIFLSSISVNFSGLARQKKILIVFVSLSSFIIVFFLHAMPIRNTRYEY